MRARVKLFGTMSQEAPDYDPAQGLLVELPDGATVAELLALLRVPPSFAGVVSVNGRIIKPEDRLAPDCEVHLLPALHGG